MPAKKRSQATPKAKPTADEPSTREDAPPAGDEPEAVTAARSSGEESGARRAAAPPAVRRTRRTISRHVVDEEIEETIVEDLPAAYSPPESGYPATVG